MKLDLFHFNWNGSRRFCLYGIALLFRAVAVLQGLAEKFNEREEFL